MTEPPSSQSHSPPGQPPQTARFSRRRLSESRSKPKRQRRAHIVRRNFASQLHGKLHRRSAPGRSGCAFLNSSRWCRSFEDLWLPDKDLGVPTSVTLQNISCPSSFWSKVLQGILVHTLHHRAFRVGEEVESTELHLQRKKTRNHFENHQLGGFQVELSGGQSLVCRNLECTY